MNKPIAVVGTGRCGSSIVAGMLFYLGVYMGEWFIKPDIHNPTGYWEDVDIAMLNSSAVYKEMTLDNWKEGMKKIMVVRDGEHKIWGFKDPLTACTIDELKKLRDFKYIYCHRDTKEIIKAARKIWGWKRRYAKKTIRERIANLSQGLIGTDCNIFLFDDLIRMDKAEAVVDRLIKFCNLEPTSKQRRRAIETVLAPAKKKHLIRVSSAMYEHKD